MSLSQTTGTSSDPTRSSQTSLCNICAHGLRLDDSCIKGVLEEPHNDGVPKLRFPLLRRWSPQRGLRGDLHGGAQFEPRYITPPHCPELSDECKFCRYAKSVIIEWTAHSNDSLPIILQVQYRWLKLKKKGRLLGFKLVSLDIGLRRPSVSGCHPFTLPIATSSGKLRLEYMKMQLLTLRMTVGSCQEWLHITGRPLDVESPFSERNVNLIRSWLEQCKTDSSCCRSAKQEEFLPTRLLDIGRSNDPSITLVETHSMAQLNRAYRPLKYICLSYRWGAAVPPLRTTKDTIEGYKAGIPVDSMSRVFRDAILVARTLGIRYLWIDALCIIQDCHEDWHNESAAMADVFSHSWITIGAATASSCHDTLFYPRQNLSIDIEFQSSIKQNITGTISILLLDKWYSIAPLFKDLLNWTWPTRG